MTSTNPSIVLADRFREVMITGRWIANTNYAKALADVNWQQANAKVGTINTIAALAAHMNYYIAGVLEVLHGGRLEISDKFSFDFPELESAADWESRKTMLLENAKSFASAVEKLNANQLQAPFVDLKYGTYERNINGMIEHGYYHLGQVVLIKKALTERL